MATADTAPDFTYPAGHSERAMMAGVAREELPALLEALLLVSPEPAELRDLADAAGVSVTAVEEALAGLNDDPTRGWVVIRHGGTAHISSAPRFAPYVRRFLRLDREARLSSAALETLALIAYRQPVTRAEIESLRGVDCSGVLATLYGRDLIEVAGRLPTVGNPHQYVTSLEFLKQFGLRSLEDLPPLAEFADGGSEPAVERLPGSTHDQATGNHGPDDPA
ncbi:MAG: segregation and condensation protein [Thermomicrobiales bacterium]|jgi:segregation and condensation protein B|nr:segregation and condensation protein [Thermomicrobiales bacterium]MCD6058698.1 segregation and condensation protein [Thermomicrobiales bacterium]